MKKSEQKMYKLVFNSLGNVIYIHILSTKNKIKYELSKIQRKSGFKMIYLYNYNFYYYNQTLNTPYQIQYLKRIFKKYLFYSITNHPIQKEVYCFIILLFCAISQ